MTQQNILIIKIQWEVLKRQFAFRMMICDDTSKPEKVKKEETVKKCQEARKKLEDFEKKILKLKVVWT